MKKMISCFLVLCLVTVATNVAFASNSYKGKIFVIEKSDVPKIEVVNSDVTVIAYESFQETDYFLSNVVIKAFADTSTNVNAIAPDILRIRDRRVIHETAYILNLPKDYLLPNKNYTWRFGSNMRC